MTKNCASGKLMYHISFQRIFGNLKCTEFSSGSLLRSWCMSSRASSIFSIRSPKSAEKDLTSSMVEISPEFALFLMKILKSALNSFLKSSIFEHSVSLDELILSFDFFEFFSSSLRRLVTISWIELATSETSLISSFEATFASSRFSFFQFNISIFNLKKS